MFFESEPKWIEYEINKGTITKSKHSEAPNIIEIDKAYYYFEPNYISFKMELNYIYDNANIIKEKIIGVDFVDAKSRTTYFKLQVNDSDEDSIIEVIGGDGAVKAFIPVKISEPEEPQDNVKLTLLPTTLIKIKETDEPLQQIHFEVEFQFPLKALYTSLSIVNFENINCYLKYYVN